MRTDVETSSVFARRDGWGPVVSSEDEVSNASGVDLEADSWSKAPSIPDENFLEAVLLGNVDAWGREQKEPGEWDASCLESGWGRSRNVDDWVCTSPMARVLRSPPSRLSRSRHLKLLYETSSSKELWLVL